MRLPFDSTLPAASGGRRLAVRGRNALPGDLAVVASWVRSGRECESWAGPRIHFPPQLPQLAAQIEMEEAINVALDDEHGLVAFGQALPRGPRRAHLARIIVRPGSRRCGAGRALVEALLARAEAAGFALATLYVYSDNAAAAALYSRLGFRPAERPREDPPSSGVVFMQRAVDPFGRA